MSNIRNDAHHKASRKIVSGCSVIGIESLTVKGLLKNRRLSKALSDAARSRLLTYIRYKAEHLGVVIVEADKFFPSSKRCSSCGHKNMKLTLSERRYHCGVCGFQVDRDINAAINLRRLASNWDESLNACGESVRPSMEGWNRGSKKTEPNQLTYPKLRLDT